VLLGAGVVAGVVAAFWWIGSRGEAVTQDRLA